MRKVHFPYFLYSFIYSSYSTQRPLSLQLIFSHRHAQSRALFSQNEQNYKSDTHHVHLIDMYHFV